MTGGGVQAETVAGRHEAAARARRKEGNAQGRVQKEGTGSAGRLVAPQTSVWGSGRCCRVRLARTAGGMVEGL